MTAPGGLRDLDECVGDATVGRKAETLARLRAAGLPVLPGVVVLPGAVVDEALVAEVRARLPGVARLAVRSSSTVEDTTSASAAGVFRSEIGVAVADVAQAIARVRASASEEPARVYLGERAATGAMAVLLQPVVAAPILGVARRLEDGRVLVEERAAGEPEWGDVAARVMDAPPAIAAAAQLVAATGGADVEYARDGETITILQARPTPPVATAASERAFVVDEGGDWVLDVEHNPRPLSPAQAGLVALVDAAGAGPRQRVLGGGWLYVARTASPRSAPVATATIAPSSLRATFDAVIAPDCEAVLARAEEAGTLAAALTAYLHVYRRYVDEVGPSLRAARRALDAALRATVGEPLSAHGALLGGTAGLTAERDALLFAIGTAPDEERPALLADYYARFGAYAPAWDVAVATDDEAPERVTQMAAAWAARGRAPSELQAEAAGQAHAAAERLCASAAEPASLAALLADVRTALPVAEDDDRLFFRAQRAVRRALLTVGDSLARAGRLPLVDDIFCLALDDVQRDDGSADLAARAAANRRAWEAAARIVPPRALVDGHPVAEPPPSARKVLRGHPTAGRARGRALVMDDPASAPTTPLPDDAILVVPALLPSLAYLLPQARALITAHGGATSHGATLAREYGVPAVLGVGRAHGLSDGTPLLVDATAGRVYIL